MSEVSTALNQLIDVAERTLCCRQPLMPAGFDDFAAEVGRMQTPVGAVISDAPGLLVALLARFWATNEAQRPLWLMAIAALLQLVRNDLSHVIEARRRPLDPDATYRTGGGMSRDDRHPSARR